jgi:thymidylate kinase/predicted kinase
MRIVLINGHVACLKTTLAYLLAPMLELGLVTTSVLGEFIADANAPTFHTLQDARYQMATVITRQFLHHGVSVILDGTFSRRLWRDEIYKLADEYNVEHVVAVTCVCSDPALINQRLAHRRVAKNSPDSAANHWDAYLGSVHRFETIEEDRLPSGHLISRLTFDSALMAITRDKSETPYAEEVARIIERLVASGRLSRPQFGLTPVTDSGHNRPAKLLIALEGLSASGKSTQSKRLSEMLMRLGRMACLFEEFSDSHLGQYLRERSAITDHRRIQVVEGAYSHTESLLVIADAIGRIRMACEARLRGAPAYEIIVADGYTWAHLAHGLALLPECANAALRQYMWTALAEILAPLRGVADLHQSVYLRITPDLASERLERRIGAKLSRDNRHFLERLFDIYEVLAEGYGTITIDASKAPQEITRQISFLLGI